MFKTSNIGIAIKNRQLNSTGPKKLALTKDNSFLVFPFNLIAGYITSTENGLRQNDNIEISDYSNFQRIFTGLESMIAQWDGAYKVEKKQDTDTFLTKEYNVGRNFKAFIPNESMAASFEPSSISSDFLAEFTDEEFTMHSYDDIEEKDLFRLFIIPELREYKWLYISNAERFFHNGVFHHIEITMTTLNNKVAKSGGSIESFIQRSAPGEGYAWPVVGINQTVSLDEARRRDVPITSGQVEMAGPAGFNTVVAFGRPTITETTNGITHTVFNPKIESPRLLLPYTIETPIPSPENTRPSAETDFYIGNFKPTLQESFKNWKDQFQSSYDISQRATYEGVLVGATPTATLTDLRASNPVANGSHTHILWDRAWQVGATDTFNTKTNSQTGDTITLTGDHKIPELLAHNYFGTSHISSLPLSTEQNITWSLNDIPVVGGFLSKLTLGVPIGWNNKAVRLAMESVKLLLPSSLAEYGSVLKGDGTASTDVWIPLETFTTERKDEAIESAGINATGTILKVQFTHRFSKTIGGVEYVFDTKDLGQNHPTTDDNGKIIAPTQTGKLLWDGTCKPANRGNVPGYVIDLTHFKSLAKLDYRQTFFSNDIQAWSGTYQTKSKFTGSIRDWTNIMKVSHWVVSDDKTVSYPAIITEPPAPGSNFAELNFSNKNSQIPQFSTKDDLIKAGIIVMGQEFVQIGSSFTTFPTSRSVAKTAEVIKNTFEYDSTSAGGINQLKNNYDFMQVSFATLTPIKFNMNDLITSGEKVVELKTSTVQFQLPQSNWVNVAVRYLLKIRIDGSKLIFETIYEYTNTSTQGERRYQPVYNPNTTSSYQTWKDCKVVPKSIV